jgi:hypothetical protein
MQTVGASFTALAMSQLPSDTPALRDLRERTITALCDHFAHDRITLEEFETRLDLAHKAVATDQLDGLVSDIRAPAATALPDVQRTLASAPASDETRLIFAMMGGAERRGNWRPGKRNVALSIMGGSVLDFRETDLPAGVTEIFVFACMGGCEIIVPPNLSVESHGFALMGGFGQFADNPPPAPGAPVLRINGFAIMGGVEIYVRLPGESARDAKRRRREERQLRRDSR